MKSFLMPFAESLRNLYDEGIIWFDREEKVMRHTKVIAPIATLDAPARAATQNVMQYNGEFGCTFCEHEGMTCETGLGFNRVFPASLDSNPTLRTKENMYLQAREAMTENLIHVKGVKGPSTTALIPAFDVAESFVPDYMHSILLGVARMLFKLWFTPAYKDRPFYVKKSFRKEINTSLSEIYPPDYVTRSPRTLMSFQFWKASEIRECLLTYFPILLKHKLPRMYYEHYLYLVQGTRLLLGNKVHLREVEVADCLLNLFSIQVEKLYGLEKCSFNNHQLSHMGRCVLLWGPLSSWSTFDFEDGNGHIKRTTHGSNKLDMEIANTLKIMNAHTILKCKLNVSKVDDALKIYTLGKNKTMSIAQNEMPLIERFCTQNNFNLSDIRLYLRINLNAEVITSQTYTRQKKRNNFYILMNDNSFGKIKYYLLIKENLFVVTQKLHIDVQSNKICISRLNLDFSRYFIPFRETYTVDIVPVSCIKQKLIFVRNFLCLPASMCEKK